MNQGTCLCGDVTWEIATESEAVSHCHCSMCRKAHGAAFATYYRIPAADFRWTGDQSKITEYASSPSLVRQFCRVCGSVVPDVGSDKNYYSVPAGSHDTGPSADCHIFTGSKAPWFDITDDLPRHEQNPHEEADFPANLKPALLPAEPGIVRGSCLCNEVQFEVTEQFKKIYNCHCSRCRRARAAAFTTNGFTTDQGVRFIRGENHIVKYKLPAAQFFTQVFCDICGSGLPRIDSERKVAVIPLGALDDNPNTKPQSNIYVGDKAQWYPITDDLPCFEAGPRSK